MGRTSASLLVVLLACGATACYDQGEGVEPPLSRIYFPVGLAISPGATRLFVANSNFDLQYNGGALQSFDLERIRGILPKWCQHDSDCGSDQRCDTAPTEENHQAPSWWCVPKDGLQAGRPCGPFGEQSAPSRLLYPGRCGYVSTTSPQDGGPGLIVAQVGIGAFATDVIYRSRPNGPGGRLFLPVRGDATLHFIDTLDENEAPMPFELECGQRGNDGDCDDGHRRGDDPDEENTRDLRMPTEPFGIDATEDGEAIVITHQTEGAASLFVSHENDWGDGVSSLGAGPRLSFVVSGLPQRPIGVAAIPEPALVTADPEIAYDPGFLVTYRNAAQVDLLRYFDDEAANFERPFLQVAGSVGITANSLNFDSRGIAVDASKRKACEAECALVPTADVECVTECAAEPDASKRKACEAECCLKKCAGVPVGVYIANRTPSSLLVGETRPNQSVTSSDDLPRIPESIAATFGPSRVIVGSVVDRDGELATRVFMVCFDSHVIGVYNPKTHGIEDWIDTGRGPHGVAVDARKDASGAAYAYAYVAHFTDSYIGVVDLDQRHGTFGTMLASIGRPSAPRASK